MDQGPIAFLAPATYDIWPCPVSKTRTGHLIPNFEFKKGILIDSLSMTPFEAGGIMTVALQWKGTPIVGFAGVIHFVRSVIRKLWLKMNIMLFHFGLSFSSNV
jgi:hypothetical protein